MFEFWATEFWWYLPGGGGNLNWVLPAPPSPQGLISCLGTDTCSILVPPDSMEALDDLYKKNARDEKQEILEGRKKKLSNLLLKEKKEFEVLCLFLFYFSF